MPFDSMNLDDTTRMLLDARGYIERGWCLWTQAVDAEGKQVLPCDQGAVRWCAYGALVAAGLRNGVTNHPAVQRLQDAMGDKNIGGYNNRQTHSGPVLEAFDRAIVGS